MTSRFSNAAPTLGYQLNAPDYRTKQQTQEIYDSLKNVQDPAYDAITKSNLHQVDDIFNQPINSLQKVKNEVKAKLPQLSHEEQQEVVTYWNSAAGFFDNVIDWVKTQMHCILDWICEGFRIVKDCVLGAFELAYKAVKGVFNWIFG
jgi:gas vesicle protein